MNCINFKSVFRVLALIFMSYLCSACVGAGTVKGTQHVWDANDREEFGLCPSSYDKMIVRCPKLHMKNITSVEEITPVKLAEMWGAPVSNEIVGRVRNIVYEQSRAWRGVVIFVIIPIPLLIPLGHNVAKFTFEDDHLIHVEYIENRLTAAICGLHSEGPNGFGCIPDWH